jgi:hypothetical protein
MTQVVGTIPRPPVQERTNERERERNREIGMERELQRTRQREREIEGERGTFAEAAFFRRAAATSVAPFSGSCSNDLVLLLCVVSEMV